MFARVTLNEVNPRKRLGKTYLSIQGQRQGKAFHNLNNLKELSDWMLGLPTVLKTLTCDFEVLLTVHFDYGTTQKATMFYDSSAMRFYEHPEQYETMVLQCCGAIQNLIKQGAK